MGTKKLGNTHTVVRTEDGKTKVVKIEEDTQAVKQQLQMQSIKGFLLGTIYLETPINDVLELMKKANHYSTVWINKNDERIHEYDVLKMDSTEFPVSAWMFPDSESIKKGVYEDLPF